MVTVFLLLSFIGGAREAQAQATPDPFNYSRSSSFTYDPVSGLLTSETVEPGNPNLCVTTSYTYDGYGNKTSATTASCNGATAQAVFTGRTSTSGYGAQTVTVAGVVGVTVPSGMFPSSVSNALNQSEQKIIDPRFGAVLSLTGPNGLTTTWQVDDFGRKTKELRADGTSTVNAYCFLPNARDTTSNNPMCSAISVTLSGTEVPADAISFVHSEPHGSTDIKNGPFSRVYLDKAGHKLRTVTEAFDGNTQPGGNNRLIVQDTDYNALGVAVVTTQPYFLDTQSSVSGNGGNYGMTTTNYDALGRPALIYTSDPLGNQGSVPFGSRGNRTASATTIAYNGLVTLTINDQNQTRQEEKNVDGKVVRITDALGAQVAHQYDAFGNLIQIRDALQNTILISYDVRGHKVAMNDPDTGNWQYQYDALGELIWQQSPNQRAQGQATTMVYDVLGRMTQRTEQEDISNWSYDHYANGAACNNGTGKLCESTTSTGVDRKVVYDGVGRPINTLTSISNGPSFAAAVSYDGTNGRLSSQTYPTGLTVNYNYTAKGFVSALTLATAATVNPLPTATGGSSGAGTVLAAGSVLWQAQAYNAWGKTEQQIYGNQVTSQASYDALTGRVTSTVAGYGGGASVVNIGYAWDSLYHLTGRSDANGDGISGAVTDSFGYDSIGRLQNYTVASPTIPGLQRNVTLEYNASGSILYKSDVGIYSYPAQGGTQPHALQQINGIIASSYGYDANGNVIQASSGSYRAIHYTSFNQPDSQSGIQGPGGTPQYTWQYDENHQRISETRVTGSGTTFTWMLHPDNAGGLGFESEQSNGLISNRHYLTVGGGSIGVLVSAGPLPVLAAGQTAPPVLGSITLVKVEYWHKDHLGSLIATTDHNGAVTARYSYDPFGKRRTASGNYDAAGNLVIDWSDTTNAGTGRGYTGHEHLDEVGLIHMNGRLFDPMLGHFMQPDPLIQDPTNLQNFNRYGYCYNNPMTCTDPTGMFLDGLISIPFLDNVWNNHIKEYAPLIAAIAISVYMPGLIQTYVGNFGSVAISGFVSGGVATGNLKGALQGSFTAGMFYGAGNVIVGGNFFTGGIDKATEFGTTGGIVLHGVVGCITNVAGGSKCGPGALSAAFSKAMLPITGPMGESNPFAGAFISSIAGGTASVLGGGKFANGAETAAFGYLFNYLMHAHYLSKQEGQMVVDQAAKWGGTPYKLVGPNSEIQVAGDCSGTTFKIYDALGDPYDYKMANQFGAAADKEGFPFQRLGANDARQPGDVLQFPGHLAIYAGQDAKGNDLMWTASTSKQSYVLQQVQYFGKPVIGTFRYQVPDGH